MPMQFFRNIDLVLVHSTRDYGDNAEEVIR